MGKCRSERELLSDIGYVFKLFEMLLIIICWITYLVTTYHAVTNMSSLLQYQLGQYFINAVLTTFWTNLAMQIVYCMRKFRDKLYEAILGIVGAVCSCLAGLSFLMGFFAESMRINLKYVQRYTNQMLENMEGARGRDLHFVTKTQILVLSICLFLLMGVFIADAVVALCHKGDEEDE